MTEFVLYVGEGSTKFPSLATLDAAFRAALRDNPTERCAAETYRPFCRTHGYRLADGRVFRRPLADWDNAELELFPTSPVEA